MTNHIKKIFHKNILFFLIFIIFLLIAIFANYVGFLSPDSRDYIDIAKSISDKFEITLNLGSGIINLVFLFVHFSIIISV